MKKLYLVSAIFCHTAFAAETPEIFYPEPQKQIPSLILPNNNANMLGAGANNIPKIENNTSSLEARQFIDKVVNDPDKQDAKNLIFERALKYTVKIKTTILQGFFGEAKGTYSGAGLLVDKERGWIFTNAHVVGRGPSVTSLAFINEKEIEAKKLYVDPYMDIAIIKIDPTKIPPNTPSASLDCSEKPRQGIQVGTVGHPRGLSWTVTSGIISGKQNIDMEYLQIDAPLNPGNSGGPLVSLVNGEILGINTAIINGSQNTNFAISSHYLCTIYDLLKENKDPSPIQLDWSFYKNTEDEGKLKIAHVFPNSQIPFLNGDEIIAVNHKEAPENSSKLIDGLRGENNVNFTIRRNNQIVNLFNPIKKQNNQNFNEGIIFSGLLVGNLLDPFIYEIKANGVLIHDVEKGSIAENIGLSNNDFLTHINGEKVDNIKQVLAKIQNINHATITIKRINAGNGNNPFVYLEYDLPIVELRSIP